MKGKKPKICFVALNSFNLVACDNDVGHIGGAEVQQLLAATWLINRGFHVSFVTLDHGQKDGSVYQGITVYKAYNSSSGLPGLRFLWPRWSKLWGALRRAKCDIYYQRGAGLETGQVAWWCRLYGKKFVHAVAHEPDCTPNTTMLPKLRERVLYRNGLRMADVVIAQTETQQKLLKQHFGKSSCLVNNCALPLSSRDSHNTQSQRFANRSVLWIGRLAPIKRFEWLLDLAAKMPDVNFVVIGGANKSNAYDKSLQNRAVSLSNVRMVGEVQYGRMHEYYRSATVLCCTSSKEGFPNVFLEAWREGIPVVSTVDPDSVVADNKLGYIANSVTEISLYLSEMLFDEEQYRDLSSNCYSYFCNNRTPESTLPALENQFIELSSSNKMGIKI